MSSEPIATYLREVAKTYATGRATEHSYRGHLQTLLEALLPGVAATNEPKQVVDCGAPDYVLTRNNGLPLGYVEAKDLGAGLDDDRHKEQFDRYRGALGNMMFTNYLAFQLWRGNEELIRVEIAALQGNKIRPLRNNFAQFAGLVKTFGDYEASPIYSSHELAQRMADKARLLALVVERALAGAGPQRASTQDLGGSWRFFASI